MPAQIDSVEPVVTENKKNASVHSSRSQSPTPSILAIPVYEPSAIPPDIWTAKMLHVWKTALEESKDPKTKTKKLVTIDDLARSSNNDKGITLTSPRSIQACLYLGIDPATLSYRSLEAFNERGIVKELQILKYEHHENSRQERIQKLQAERAKIMQKEEDDRHVAAADFTPGSHRGREYFKEKERQRLEVMRRRQRRDLEQMAKYEAQRQQLAAENQARQDAERRADEQKRWEKAKKEKEWQAEIRKRELQRMKEEEALDRKSKQMAAERYMREQQQLAAEQVQMRHLRKETVRKEQERIAKQEEFRKQMERVQEVQQEVLRKKQEEMHQKDLERQRNLEEHNKGRARQHMEARKQAEARHAAAVANFNELMRKREEEYQKRQEELRIKLKRQEEEHKLAEIEEKKREEAKEQQRLQVIQEAHADRDKKVQELLQKAEESDMIRQTFIVQRQLAHARKVVERQLEFENKHARAESMKRVKALHRFQILQRIEEETERVSKLLESKALQQERHRKANANLSIHRQTMLQQMEKLSISKKWRDSLSEADREELDEAHKQRTNSQLPPISEEGPVVSDSTSNSQIKTKKKLSGTN